MQKGDYVKVVKPYKNFYPQESGSSGLVELQGCKIRICEVWNDKIKYRAGDHREKPFYDYIPISYVEQITKKEFEMVEPSIFSKAFSYAWILLIPAISAPLLYGASKMNLLNEPLVINSAVGLIITFATCLGLLAANFTGTKVFQGLGKLADRHRRIRAAKAEEKANAELKQLEMIVQKLTPSPLAQMEAIVKPIKIEAGKWHRVRSSVVEGGELGAFLRPGVKLKGGDYVFINDSGVNSAFFHNGSVTQTMRVNELEPI